jgi:hypothetical protein
MGAALALGDGERPMAEADFFSTLEDLDLRRVVLRLPAAVEAAALRAHGVTVCGVAPGADVAVEDAAIARAARRAAATKADALVLEGGRVAGDDRGRATERAARVLHPFLGAGVPLAIRPGGAAEDLLGYEEVSWLLDALPRLGLWLDPARAMALQRAGHGPAVSAWAEACAGRCTGVWVHGLGGDGKGGAHLRDDGPPWEQLAEMLPTRRPWVLDLAPDAGRDALRDALGDLRSVLGRDA